MTNEERDIKAFTIPKEAWYKDVIPEKPCIHIGLYSKDGGVKGEFRIDWEDLGIRLLAFHDSWETLSNMPELIELMAEISKKRMNPTIKEFAELLEDIGLKDLTERRREDDR